MRGTSAWNGMKIIEELRLRWEGEEGKGRGPKKYREMDSMGPIWKTLLLLFTSKLTFLYFSLPSSSNFNLQPFFFFVSKARTGSRCLFICNTWMLHTSKNIQKYITSLVEFVPPIKTIGLKGRKVKNWAGKAQPKINHEKKAHYYYYYYLMYLEKR